MSRSAEQPSNRSARRHPDAISLDDIDRALLRHLATDARLTNHALAERVGIAASTCLMRVRRLHEAGVIVGFRAEISPAAVGRGLQALVLVHLRADARRSVGTFGARLADLPGVVDALFLGGANDFQLRVAVRSSDELRDLVSELSSMREVANTETNLIFEVHHGTTALV